MWGTSLTTAKSRDTYLKYRYGITLDEYERLLVHQERVCAICKKPNTGGKVLHVDHQHTRGERRLKLAERKALIRDNVRGLLCWKCNGAIARFRDNPTDLRSAADYLESWPAKQIITIKTESNENV